MNLEEGAYVYLRNGEPTRVKETWVRQQQDDGSWRIESERFAGDVHMAVSARGSGRRVRDFAVTWAGKGVGKFAVDYRPKGDEIAVIRWQDSRATRLAPITGSPLLSPLMRIFAGPLIAEILESGGQAQVLVPDIRDTYDAENLLRPLVSERSARLIEHDGDSRVVAYEGDQYGSGTRFWLGADDLLERYEWRQSEEEFWEVSLER